MKLYRAQNSTWLCLLLALAPLPPVHAQAQQNFSKTLVITPIADTPAFQKRALVIGVQDYENVAPFKLCDAEAQQFSAFLTNKLGFDQLALVSISDSTSDFRQRPTYLHLKSHI